MKIDSYFATRNSRMKASEIRELLKLLDQPDVISFAGGIPDPALFPTEKFRIAMDHALANGLQDQALQYSTSEGDPALRRWIAKRMTGLGVPCEADNILITSGSQQALDFLGKLFLSPGDTALVGWPTYLGALGAFNAYEPRYDRLDPMGNRGPAAITAEAEANGGRVKFSYLSPDFANPTGITLSRDERLKVLEQAEALDCMVIEDAAYQSLRYEGAEIPPILSLELAAKGDLDQCRTIYCGSFSKTLSPGLRVGWVCAARPVIDQMVLLKQAGDLHTATLNQMAVAHVAENGFEDHVQQLCAHYGAKRDRMLAALLEHMPDGIEWTRPDGGMFIWVTLPRGMDGATLLARALSDEKVAFVPGGAFYPDDDGRNTLRLNFSSPDPAEIDMGIARLARVIFAAMSEG